MLHLESNTDGVLKTEGDYEGMVGYAASSTQSFDITATETGNHQLRFTFFDGSGDGTTTTGSFDEVYVYQKKVTLLFGKRLLRIG